LNQPYINVSSLNNLTVYGLLNQKVGQHREFSLVGGNKKFFTPKFKFLNRKTKIKLYEFLLNFDINIKNLK
jgi:hypothetical protein